MLYEFQTLTGKIRINHDLCRSCDTRPCIAACGPGILALKEGLPTLAVTVERAAKGGCTECLACELDCAAMGQGAVTVLLPIPGLEVARP